MSLIINGKPTVTGSVLIPSECTGALQLPGITFQLVFQPGTLAAGLDVPSATIKLTGFDEPLGATCEFPGLTINGQPHALALTVHTVGGQKPARIVHYTLYSA